MKKSLLTIAFTALTFFDAAVGQNHMTFTFTGVNGSSYFKLDSLKVRNLSQDCDTVLYYPDTVLTIYNVGINEKLNLQKGFKVMQNYPNPAAGQTFVRICMPQIGLVHITITDAAGRRLLASDMTMDKGVHTFSLTLPGKGFYLLNTCWNDISSSIRIVATAGSGQDGPCLLEYSGETPASNPLKSFSSVEQFQFNPGDELMLTGYGDGLESGFLDSPESSQDYVFQFATNLPCPGLDSLFYDGQWYHTIQVFSQCWIVENMNTGIMIQSSQAQANNDVVEKYCMGDNEYYCSYMGGLYFWNEMMKYTSESGGQGICPDGFHVPGDRDWQILEGAADSELEIGAPSWASNGWRGTDAGGNLKQTGTEMWEPPNSGATDAFGFMAIPAGYFVQGDFWGPGYKTYIWSSDPAGKYYRNLDWNQVKIQRNTGGTGAAFSVRCIGN
jgi:uncharacterized protein (TIGR02145 family)